MRPLKLGARASLPAKACLSTLSRHPFYLDLELQRFSAFAL
jgi:hypothetical protein